MPTYYTYLISTLPALRFLDKPPLSFDKFLAACQDKIPQQELGLLKSSSDFLAYEGTQQTLCQMRSFETALRNELVRIRASRKHIDPLKFIRQDGYVQPYISHIAANAYRNVSTLESEKMLDEARWKKLDELSLGHYFDLDILIIYALKLQILERWDKINALDKQGLLQEVLN